MAEREEHPDCHGALTGGDEAACHEVDGLAQLVPCFLKLFNIPDAPKCGLRLVHVVNLVYMIV